MKKIILILIVAAFCYRMCAQFTVGIGRRMITPETPIWLSGYASRNKPSTEVLHDLWAKAIVIEENKKIRIIIVTMDIIGLPHELSRNITQQVMNKYGISRSQLLLNTSHTHSGPVIWPSLSMMFDLGKEDLKALIRYNHKLSEDIIGVIDQAFLDLKPSNLYIAHGSADIAINRRQATEKGVVIGVNREGPVDMDVPVLKVESQDGKLRAVLFGYACHNTTLDIYQVNGDYAGFAQSDIEKANDGVTAMYMAGCGADQNPDPRRSVGLAKQHGKTLADAVQNVLAGEFKPVRPPVRTDFTTINLDLAPYSRSAYEDELIGDDRYRMRRAGFVLAAMDKGYDTRTLSYPVQAVRFGKDFTLLALSGEVVVDYSLKSKIRYPEENLFVAGYCTEVQCYIPSERVLKEGGYEAETSMIYYGLPGPFRENIEEKVFSAIDKVMKKTGAKADKKK